MKMTLKLAEYAILVAASILAYYGILIEQGILEASGFSAQARILALLLPSLALVFFIICEVFAYLRRWKRNWLGYLALVILFFVFGFTPIANLLQGVNIFIPLPCSSVATILVLPCLLLAIAYDASGGWKNPPEAE